MPYVYAVIENGAGEPAPPLYAVRRGRVAAVVADRGVPEATPDALIAHEEVVEALMDPGPVLPMRFGSTTADVAGLLAEREDELAGALERVRGAVELGVREAGGCAPPPATGTDYLMGRTRLARMHEALAPHARAAVRARRSPHVGAYLVHRDAVDAFRARVAGLDAALVCTGPWPPYSFPTP